MPAFARNLTIITLKVNYAAASTRRIPTCHHQEHVNQTAPAPIAGGGDPPDIDVPEAASSGLRPALAIKS
jgi:hypothetical protein